MKDARNPFSALSVHQLYIKGKTQKEIAEIFQVTPKTIGKWLKELKASIKKNKSDIQQLRAKLDLLLNDQNANTNDIKNLTTSIENLERIWFNKMIKK